MNRLALYWLILAYFAAAPLLAQEVVDSWRYTLRKPADGWHSTTFEDVNWKDGAGGFGTMATPGARVGTIWRQITFG